MLYTLYVALAGLFIWESVRFAVSEYAARAYSATVALQPLVVAVFPVVILWPDWLRALAVAGLIGMFHVVISRFAPDPVPTFQPPRRESRRSGLPSLP